MNNRIIGSSRAALIECINPVKNKWRIRWDIQSEGDNASWLEQDFDHKPDIEEIKEIILAWYNKNIEKQIISGFKWKDIPVWLSSENQFNFKAAYDLAYQTQGAALPVTFKLGTDEDPVLHQFLDMEDFQDFYMKSLAYIQSVLSEGWRIKGSINWSEYEVE